MSLVMTLLVRDEEDILDANMRYHLDAGVEHIVVTDNLSVDGTPDIIDDYVRQGVATYIRETEDTYAQSKWVTRMARLAAERKGVRWVIHSDADEFWMPDGGRSLSRYFALRPLANVVMAKRHDFVCLEDDGAPFWQRMIWKKRESVNPLGRDLPPKVAHRPHPDAVVAQGNHKVSGIGRQRRRSSGVEILHFPLRSRTQYFTKIRNGGRAYANNPDLPETVGSTWRQQYRELEETGTLTYVDESIVSADALARLTASGNVVQDTRLRDHFAKAGR